MDLSHPGHLNNPHRVTYKTVPQLCVDAPVSGRGLANPRRVEARSARCGSRERLRGVALRWRSYLAGGLLPRLGLLRHRQRGNAY